MGELTSRSLTSYASTYVTADDVAAIGLLVSATIHALTMQHQRTKIEGDKMRDGPEAPLRPEYSKIYQLGLLNWT